MKTRIALLEDHVVVRRALRGLIERDKDLRVVGEAGSARELLLIDAEYDLLISDIGLPGPNGVSAVAEVKRRWPKRRVLVLTMYDDTFRAAEALAAGADGYAVKTEDDNALVEAIHIVASGQRWISPLVDRAEIDRLLERRRARVVATGPLAPLSMREREIFDLMIRGYSCQDIGALLFISPRTADTHRSHIFEKLGVHSVAELVRYAARFGLLGPPEDRRALG
jgi:two-component system, NarL family, response regulator NreC